MDALRESDEKILWTPLNLVVCPRTLGARRCARLYAVRFDSSSRCHLALISRADAEALRRTAARNPSTLTFIRAVLARSLTALCASSLLYELYPADGID